MKKDRRRIIVFIIFITGLSLLLYPQISSIWSEHKQEQTVEKYSEAVKKNEANNQFAAEREKAVTYNESLLPQELPQAFDEAEKAEIPDEEYVSCLTINGDGMMGYVEIPKIDVKVAIYHSTDGKVLEAAAGHIEGSSLPIGGETTHAIISAHRGLPTAELFTKLDQLEIGDVFSISVLDETLYYEVDQIAVVEPSNIEFLKIEEGKDLVTLMTCTPYGINSHRLLVRGARVQEVTDGR